jgi:hypothetical protein
MRCLRTSGGCPPIHTQPVLYCPSRPSLPALSLELQWHNPILQCAIQRRVINPDRTSDAAHKKGRTACPSETQSHPWTLMTLLLSCWQSASFSDQPISSLATHYRPALHHAAPSPRCSDGSSCCCFCLLWLPLQRPSSQPRPTGAPAPPHPPAPPRPALPLLLLLVVVVALVVLVALALVRRRARRVKARGCEGCGQARGGLERQRGVGRGGEVRPPCHLLPTLQQRHLCRRTSCCCSGGLAAGEWEGSRGGGQ